MSDEDFGSYDDFLKVLEKSGGSRPIGNILRYRQGADMTSWATGGAQKFIPASWFIQVGAARWTGAAAGSGVKEVTFPAPFLDDPIVLVTATDTTPLFKRVDLLASLASPASLEIYWWSTVNLTAVTIAWLAIGPART